MPPLDRLRSARAPLVAHLAILFVGLVAYLLVASREWFFSDDWYYLTQQQNIIWAPHVGHWSTVPALVFLGIQHVFGMGAYLPFAIPAILTHLGIVHLVWRITLRAGVRPWLATAFSLLLAFLGAGAEAIDWAVQIGFIGAIVGMLGAIILLDASRLTWLRGIAAGALVLVSLATSEVSIPFILAAVALSWIRHGIRRTIAVFVVPFLAFLVWYLVVGRADPSYGQASGISQLLQVPQFAVSMLSDGLGRMFPLVVLGGLVFIAIGIWWIFTVRASGAAALPAYLLFLVAPVFALITGYSRIAYGLATASSSRYVYVVVVAIAPLMAFALDRVTRRFSVVPVVALVLIVAAWNVGGLTIALLERIHRAETTRAELAVTVATMRADPGCLAASDRPSPQWADEVTVGDIQRWLDQGWLDQRTFGPPAVPAGATTCLP